VKVKENKNDNKKDIGTNQAGNDGNYSNEVFDDKNYTNSPWMICKIDCDKVLVKFFQWYPWVALTKLWLILENSKKRKQTFQRMVLGFNYCNEPTLTLFVYRLVYT
jgi:hypothetical protein